MAFIQRKSVPKKMKDGDRKKFHYYYLVETYREEGKHKKRVVDYLGTAEQAIAKLEASGADEQEKSKLRTRLEQLIADEAGAHQSAQIA